jgi:hypothetical protein
MRVIVTHIWGSGTVVTRTVDATENSGGIRWDDLAARALADPPPYRPVPGGAICHIQVNDQVVMVAERDLAGPLLELSRPSWTRQRWQTIPARRTKCSNQT